MGNSESFSKSSKELPEKKKSKLSPQIIANIGLFHVCRELSRIGLSVAPTARNTGGIDAFVANPRGFKHASIQIKCFTNNNQQKICQKISGNKEEALKITRVATFWVFVRIDKTSYNPAYACICHGDDRSVIESVDTKGNNNWNFNPFRDKKAANPKWRNKIDDDGWKLIKDYLV